MSSANSQTWWWPNPKWQQQRNLIQLVIDQWHETQNK
jgi:hypothetical protein